MKKSLPAAALTLALAVSLTACGGDGDNLSPDDRAKASQAALAATGGGSVTDADRGDGDDNYAYEVEVTFANGSDINVELDEGFKVTNNPPKASAFAAPAPAATSNTSNRNGDNDDADDVPLTGDTLKKASAAALEGTNGGEVTETGGSDDRDHVYEVDVLLDDGEDVTVELDKEFKITTIDR